MYLKTLWFSTDRKGAAAPMGTMHAHTHAQKQFLPQGNYNLNKYSDMS